MMVFRRLLRALSAVLMLALIAVGAMMFWLSDDERARRSLSRLVAMTTPYELQMDQWSIHWRPFRVTTPLALLRYPQPDKPPVMSVQDLDLSLPLGQLVFGGIDTGYLTARNISYYLDDSDSEQALDLEALLSPLARLPARLEVASIHLVAGGEELWIFPLLGLSAERQADGIIAATTEALIGDRRVSLDARARWKLINTGSHYLELDGEITDPAGDSDLQARGRLDADGPTLAYHFQLAGHYADVGDFIAAFDDTAFPFQGDLIVAGQLDGDLNGYRLAINELTLTTPEAYRFTARGSASQAGTGPVLLDLAARGRVRRVEALLPLPTALSAKLTDSELLLDVAGTLDAPILESAAISLASEDGSTLTISAEDQQVALQDLESLTPGEFIHGRFELASPDPARLLNLEATPSALPLPKALRARGRLEGSSEHMLVRVERIDFSLVDRPATGSAEILWQQDEIAARSFDLSFDLTHDSGHGQLKARGSVADLSDFQGLGVQVTLQDVSVATLASELSPEFDVSKYLSTDISLSGKALVQRPGDLLIIRDVDAKLATPAGIHLGVGGDARLGPQGPEADLRFALETIDSTAWRTDLAMPGGPDVLTAQLRARPGYATLIADATFGETMLQTVASADLADGSVREVGIDLYSDDLILADLKTLMPGERSEPADSNDGDTTELPDFPLHLTFRADHVAGPLTDMSNLNIAVDVIDKQVLLKTFDSRYAGGDLSLRGVMDFTAQPAAFSLAGRGIRVPLGALTRDLEFQESISGDLSLRLGVTTRGTELDSWLEQLQGSAALAMTDTTISGAAYDLLMSNLLAWLVKGAGEKTTTFDCTMASFQIADGVARTQDLYIETPRMQASGKGRFDLPRQLVDVRIEPRSKGRTLQFPSAVSIEGPMADPGVRVSALQTTADLSAQALLLLPSLPLKLFGMGGAKDQLLPCETPGS